MIDIQADTQWYVKHAAVLGAGAMGAQIAGLLASLGISCDLLDRPAEVSRNRLALDAKDRLSGLTPNAIASTDTLDLIRPGNFADHMHRLTQCDWVIEAIVEDLEAKKQIWSEAARFVPPNVIASSNTSGITITSIAEALPQHLRKRFLGTHFYNPPHHMRLLELIPAEHTEPGPLKMVSEFAESVLKKEIVYSRDVPNFIGNRIGIASLLFALPTMDQFDLTPSEVDSVTGLAMGRPRSATFHTLDLIGLDILERVCENIRRSSTNPREQNIFSLPDYIDTMIERGWTGDKVGRGFYKRGETEHKHVTALDVNTFEYGTAMGIKTKSLTAALQIQDPIKRLVTISSSDDIAGRVAWRVISGVMSYAAQLVGPVAYDIVSIDRTMRWGFGWRVGPFQAWDSMGVSETIRRMHNDQLEIPEWILNLARAGRPFYLTEGNLRLQATPNGSYYPIK